MRHSSSLRFILLALPLLGVEIAYGQTITLICGASGNPDDMTMQYEPTVVEVDESTRIAKGRYGGTNLGPGSHVTGGEDGRGGDYPFDFGPVSAQFESNKILFSIERNGGKNNISIDRLTGRFIMSNKYVTSFHGCKRATRQF